jgi:hypothetical protein
VRSPTRWAAPSTRLVTAHGPRAQTRSYRGLASTSLRRLTHLRRLSGPRLDELDWLRPSQAAQLMVVHVNQLWTWRRAGLLPTCAPPQQATLLAQPLTEAAKT